MVKFFTASNAGALVTAINTFLGESYTAASIDWKIVDGYYQAMVIYNAVATTAAAAGDS